jgi:tetratricopeptide (TPR) repeat protein
MPDDVIYNIERAIFILFVIALVFFCFNMFMFKEKLQDADIALAKSATVELPNDAKALQDTAIEKRKLGQFDEAIKIFDAALKIHPRDDSLVYDRALTAFFARRLQEAEDGFLRAQGLNPNNTNASIKLAELKYFSTGDAGKAQVLVRGEQAEVLLSQIELLTIQKKYDEALALIPKYQASSPAAASQTPMVKGILLASAGRQEAALPLLLVARTKLGKDLASVPGYSVEAQNYKHKLALVEAFIGNERVAREITLEALALMPPEKDATIGAMGITQAAHMYAVLDRADLVVEMLARLRSLPGTDLRTSAASLRADPVWDKINDDQRFQDEIILF